MLIIYRIFIWECGTPHHTVNTDLLQTFRIPIFSVYDNLTNFKQLIHIYLQSTLMLNPLPFITEFDLNTRIKFVGFEKKSSVTRPHLMSAMVVFEICFSYIVKLSLWQP